MRRLPAIRDLSANLDKFWKCAPPMKTNKRFIYSLLLTFFVIGLQCKRGYHTTSHKAIYKSLYVDQFKLTYFRKLLIKVYNNSDAIQQIIRSDRSGFTEPILTMEDLKIIDSLTTLDNQMMTADSTNAIGRVAEGAEGKHILGFIMRKMDGRRLDSLAKERYKRSGASQFLND